MLSHRNILANVEGCRATGMARPDDVFLSFLPLSHMFERTGGYYLPLAIGAKVAFSRGIAQLPEDLASERPTAMFAVPRVFERFAARIRDGVAGSPWKRGLLERCVVSGARVELGGATLVDRLATPVLRTLVARPILDRFGGRLRLAVVGGAAMDPAIAGLFIGLGLPVLQGYGMTEASPVVSVNRLDDNDPETVGPALDNVEVRLGEAGELLVRGPSVMLGYWNDPAATARVLDGERWLHTGDVAEFERGHIAIRGRLKDILVLSNGEKLPPQDAELAILGDGTFEQLMLIGEGRPFLTLLAVAKDADEKQLVKRANDRLAHFPRYVRVRRAIVEPRAVDGRERPPHADPQGEAERRAQAFRAGDRRGVCGRGGRRLDAPLAARSLRPGSRGRRRARQTAALALASVYLRARKRFAVSTSVWAGSAVSPSDASRA